jgi:hypothetical protein
MLFFVCTSTLYPCTNAIVSGKVTADGRPLLWKNRDTSFLQNKIMYFEDGKYQYFGLVNSADEDGEEVWVGMNAAGFAIMNSASYNLKPDDDTTKIQDREGIVMKLALQQCATLEDFEALLHDLPKPLGVETNFGVIDAHGGAAIYETGNFTFRKFDANDPEVAPNGYLISTNFSVSGDQEKGSGYIRFETATALFEEQLKNERLSARFILSDVTRSLKHSRVGIDLREQERLPAGTTTFSFFRDFIPRFLSSSSIVVRGVMQEESPEYTTMFTILGFPLTSVMVPLWLAGGDNFPGILKANKNGMAPLSDASLRLKENCFPIHRGSGRDYINLNTLLNLDHTGILQLLPQLEDEIFLYEEQFFASMIRDGIEQTKIEDFYNDVEKMVTEFYEANFGVSL